MLFLLIWVKQHFLIAQGAAKIERSVLDSVSLGVLFPPVFVISIQLEVRSPFSIEINNANPNAFLKFSIFDGRFDTLDDCAESFCFRHKMSHFYRYYHFYQVQSFFYVNFVLHDEIYDPFCQHLRAVQIVWICRPSHLAVYSTDVA